MLAAVELGSLFTVPRQTIGLQYHGAFCIPYSVTKERQRRKLPLAQTRWPPAKRRRPQGRTLQCELTRLSSDTGNKVIPSIATRDQWTHYWGGSDMQRVGKFFEVSAVAFLGVWACYFMSFFIGVGATSVIGAAFLFYWVLAPNLSAVRRNQALKGKLAPFPGARGNYAALFSANVANISVEYHPITGQPVFLRLIIEDGEGRALKFRTRTRSEYARIRAGMVAEAVLISPDETFEEIVGVTDTFIPAASIWVGEYPYVDKVMMKRLLARRYRMRKRRQSKVFNQRERMKEDDDDDDYDGVALAYMDDTTRSGDSEGDLLRPATEKAKAVSEVYSDDGRDDEGDGELQYVGWASDGFSARGGMNRGDDAYNGPRPQRWERVAEPVQPRRRSRAYRAERPSHDYSDRTSHSARVSSRPSVGANERERRRANVGSDSSRIRGNPGR